MQRFNTFKLGEDQDGPVKLPFDGPGKSLIIELARLPRPWSFFCVDIRTFFSWTFWGDQVHAVTSFFTVMLAMFVAGARSVDPSNDQTSDAVKWVNRVIQCCVMVYPMLTCLMIMTRAAEFNTRKVIC